MLAALADHGFTPTAIVTRLTYLSAPDSVQGALAAGLLGGGSRFLGVTEDTRPVPARRAGRRAATLPADDAGWDALALETVRAQRAAGRFVPGLGHHVHKDGDPRTPRLMQIAREEGQFGPHLALFDAIGRVHPQVLGRTLPLNGAGVCGAALADLGLPLPLLRGFALLARTAGLIGQLAEELRHPVGNEIFLSVDRNNRLGRRRSPWTSERSAVMQAAVIETPGAPPRRARPSGVPQPGRGEVLVAVAAAPIIPLDRLCASGTSYFGRPAMPYVPGVQGVGVVERDGASPGHPGLVRHVGGDAARGRQHARARARSRERDVVALPHGRRPGAGRGARACPPSRRGWR